MHCPSLRTPTTEKSLAADGLNSYGIKILTVDVNTVDTLESLDVHCSDEVVLDELVAALGSLLLGALVLRGAFLDGGEGNSHGGEGDKGDDVGELHFERLKVFGSGRTV